MREESGSLELERGQAAAAPRAGGGGGGRAAEPTSAVCALHHWDGGHAGERAAILGCCRGWRGRVLDCWGFGRSCGGLPSVVFLAGHRHWAAPGSRRLRGTSCRSRQCCRSALHTPRRAAAVTGAQTTVQAVWQQRSAKCEGSSRLGRALESAPPNSPDAVCRIHHSNRLRQSAGAAPAPAASHTATPHCRPSLP